MRITFVFSLQFFIKNQYFQPLAKKYTSVFLDVFFFPYLNVEIL